MIRTREGAADLPPLDRGGENDVTGVKIRTGQLAARTDGSEEMQMVITNRQQDSSKEVGIPKIGTPKKKKERKVSSL